MMQGTYAKLLNYVQTAGMLPIWDLGKLILDELLGIPLSRLKVEDGRI